MVTLTPKDVDGGPKKNADNLHVADDVGIMGETDEVWERRENPGTVPYKVTKER